MFQGSNIYKFVSFREDYLLISSLLVFTLIEGLVPSISSILIGRCFKIFTNIYYKKYSTYNDMYHDLVMRAMSLVMLAAGYFPVSWISISLWMRFGEIQNFRIRSTIFDNYMKKNLNFFDSHENLTAEFTQINRCIEELRQSCSEASGMALQSIIGVIALFCVSCYYSWSLTLIFLCSAPLVAIIAAICSKKYEKYTDLENDASLKCSHQILNIMENISMIKLNLTENTELESFNKKINECNTLFIKGSFWTAFNQAALRMLSLCMFVQGFWFGSSQIKKGHLSTEKVMTCFASCISLSSTLMSIIRQVIIIQKGKVALKYIDKLFYSENNNDKHITSSVNARNISLPLDIRLTKDVQNNNVINYHIKLENVTAFYNSRPNVNVLQNVSIDFLKDDFTYIVGKSGSGKSTIFNLLLKLYENSYQGNITLNGVDIKDIPTKWLLSQITLVEQSTHMFNDSIKNNILLGSDSESNYNENKLSQVLSICELNSVIETLPNGLDTIIGNELLSETDNISPKSKDNGSQENSRSSVVLSGGQQQRVAIARALYRNSPVIIFDESLSSIDIKTKQKIFDNLKEFRKNRTTIVLTHDLSPIEDQNMVYLLKNGNLMEHGLKKDLINKPDSDSSLFKKLYELQTLYQKDAVLSNDAKNINSLSTRSSDVFEKEKLEENDELLLPETQRLSLYAYKRLSTLINHEKDEMESNESVESEMKIEEIKSTERLPMTSMSKIFKSMYSTITMKKILFLGIAASIISGVSNPVFSWADSKLINANVLQGKHTPSSTTTDTSKPIKSATPSDGYMVKWCMIVIAIAAIDGISTFVKEFFLQYVAEYWIMDLRSLSVSKILNNDINWFSYAINKPSEISALLMNDLRDMRTLVSQFLTFVITIIFVAACGLIWSIVSGWKLSLVGLSLIPLYILTTVIYSLLLQNMENKYKSSIANLENKQYEILKNFKTIKILQLESYFYMKLSYCYNDLKNVGIKRTYGTGFGVAVFASLTYIVQAIIIFYGLKLVINGEYSTSKLFQTFSLLLFTIITCGMMSSAVPNLARGQRGATYVFNLINKSFSENKNIEGYIPNRVVKDILPLIKVDDLSFSYPSSSKQILNKLNFEIRKGETVGLVGPSGCGKSTFLQLLSKLQEYNCGSIKIDGHDINDWNLDALRKFIVFFQQKILIFKDNLRNNLNYGNNASEEEMYFFIEKFHLSELLDQLNGLDGGMVDETLISGGQLQRLNIIRQLLRLKSLGEECQLCVLDEITSSLDAETTDLIEDYFIKDIEQTKIIITHHKSLMSKCDRILVINHKGELQEQGQYNQLINDRSSYLNKLLYDLN
ncbi:unnamed protein product [Hanseniaspora opuntiae]